MAIHNEVLSAARRLCRERRGWTFKPEELVRALPDLNASSVRTHIVSRCCVNAPKNHPHKWDYFQRIRRGVYEILPRTGATRARSGPASPKATRPMGLPTCETRCMRLSHTVIVSMWPNVGN